MYFYSKLQYPLETNIRFCCSFSSTFIEFERLSSKPSSKSHKSETTKMSRESAVPSTNLHLNRKPMLPLTYLLCPPRPKPLTPVPRPTRLRTCILPLGSLHFFAVHLEEVSSHDPLHDFTVSRLDTHKIREAGPR